MRRLGDMHIEGEPPLPLLKALAVIATELHPAFEAQPWIKPQWSKRSCVLCSLAVRDFLWKIGFDRARAVPVYFAVWAYKPDGTLLHSAGVGDHVPMGQRSPGPDTVEGWNGHMAVEVDGWLIDTTLYQVQRPQWAELPAMVAVRLDGDEAAPPVRGHAVLAGRTLRQEDGTRVEAAWFDQPRNKRWKDGGDSKRERRDAVVKRLVKAVRS